MGRSLMKYSGIRAVLFVTAVLTLLQCAAIIGAAYWLAETISALFAGEPLAEQLDGMLLFLLAFAMRHVMSMLQQKAAHRFASDTGASMRRELMEKLFQLGPRFSSVKGTGNLVTLALEGVTMFRNYLELIIPRMVGTAIVPALVLGYVYWLDVRSGVILTLTLPILIVFMILIGLAARKQMEAQWESYRSLSNHFVDSLRGLETLKFLGQSRAHGSMIARVSEKYRSATMRTLRVAFLSSFALDFFTMLSVASVAVNLGLRLVNGEIMLFPALTVLILAPEYFLPVRMVGADYHATLNGKEAGEAIQAIIDEPVAAEVHSPVTAAGREDPLAAKTEADGLTGTDDPTTGRANEPIGAGAPTTVKANEPIRTDATTTMKANNPIRTDDPSAAIAPFSPTALHQAGELQLTLSSVSVQHDPEGPLSLEGVSLHIQGPAAIGIIGASGAGKSTLIDVLGGFQAASAGTISWNGKPVSLAHDSWRRSITYIPQQPYLFSRSLADNIRFYTPEASSQAVREAAAAAGLSELADELPHGFDEMIGGGGRPLSGGQAQRVALARAFLGERPVIMLDEPTAHLDIETEYELKEQMLPLFQGKLVFLATHRLHWMPDMDHIIVLQHGKVAETGTHEQLLERQGVYYDMITAAQQEGWH
ncbi:ATP-binding/permease protein CydD [Paenibacillus plantiphilus]|uniref:ATP-binding/permease protein CydD n=1 Tax=Paenibacillus plantiphilus TaxID=2905650 RepID=A0ABM9C7V7_9BACL|nr:thiol reductant ABC exporter subunit CydD [Paenibacillus plantiphilus]CAH1206297.1 ATP-binding/permease protein CydD [Paenibacillus plantiphilus]